MEARRSDNRGVWLALGAAALILVSLLAAGTGMMRGYGMMGPGWGFAYGGRLGDGWGWGLGLGMLGMVVVWVLVVAAVVLGVRALTADRGGFTPASARELLDRRFAAGELTREQYEEMRRTLGPA
jgi:putative membrane protein